jgi:NADPH:quinone reductase-like Zn-dependent oxidoreductase
MKAILHTAYGPPELLQLTDVEKPTPTEGRVLVRVHASSINAADYRPLKPDPFFIRFFDGLLRPKDPRFGSDLAGRVEAVGENVTQFRPGDEVFGCGAGAYADYAVAREAYLAPKPASKSFEEAAAVPIAGLTALQGIRWAGGIQPGQAVLVQGASGGVGMFAVQLAKAYGAEVTAVCSTRNLDMARSIGADHVIDYTREDFTLSPQRYDLIYAANGYHPLSAYKRALKPGGVYVCAGGTMPQIFQALLFGSWMSRDGEKKMGSMGVAKVIQEDLATLGEFLEAGKIAPVIDASYPLNETAKAFRYVEDEHVHGKVIISVKSDED